MCGSNILTITRIKLRARIRAPAFITRLTPFALFLTRASSNSITRILRRVTRARTPSPRPVSQFFTSPTKVTLSLVPMETTATMPSSCHSHLYRLLRGVLYVPHPELVPQEATSP